MSVISWFGCLHLNYVFIKMIFHGVRYFGRAKDLPGVRELFEQDGRHFFCPSVVVITVEYFIIRHGYTVY